MMFRLLITLVLAAASGWGWADSATLKEQDADPVYVQGDCRFRLKVEPGDGFRDGYRYMFYNAKPVGWGFSFGCFAGANQEEVDARLYAKKINGVWMNLYSGTPEPFTKKESFKETLFNGLNWSGVAISSNMTTGPEEMRKRITTFCLVQTKGGQVLCGEVQESLMFAKNKGQVLRDTIKVLKTLVFVELPTSQPLLPSAAPAASGERETRQ
jgi:hypothetical protein